MSDRPVFYYDLGSPHAYLAAERVNAALGEVPEWQPILMPPGPVDRAEVERDAQAQGLMPVRWPEGWPGDTRAAMLAATFAKETGRAVAFSLAAFRQEFAAGRDLSLVDNVLIAAAACELHPAALLKAISSRGIAERLDAATAEAAACGVRDVPALWLEGELLEARRCLQRVQSA